MDHLGNLFNESIQHTLILNTSGQQDVKLAKTLLESDLRNLSKAMKKILKEDLNKVKSNFGRIYKQSRLSEAMRKKLILLFVFRILLIFFDLTE